MHELEADYAKIGLKIGLEVHQQLDTSSKLFCDCRPELSKEESTIKFLRRLRPTQSELGQIDPAAFFEFQKGVRIRYEADTKTSCLVEMDEEPPHPLNMEAVDTVLTVALMMRAKPVDEIHVMRKTVIDGSNTTGFQRTCAIALDGEIQVREKAVPLQHLSLEEDAARKTGDEEGNIIRYHIDRLGIPLIEVTTAPVIYSPKEAGEVALAIGSTLRATGKARRGLGTIRQDINVSITNGALVEVKGVQELELVPLTVEFEVQRQLNLLKISVELRRNGIKGEEIKTEFHEVTGVFKLTKSKAIRKALDNTQRVLAVKLPNFKGYLKRELLPNYRLGTEMADRARFWGKVGGIFHTDEMPAYGITVEEIQNLRVSVKAEESDAVVFVADKMENAREALKAVVERAKEAIKGVPEETRAANPDGTTRYMRPKPGAARMYPETDIPQIQITQDHIQMILSKLPELPERKMKRLVGEYGLNQKLAKQILESPYAGLFETVVKESGASPTIIAVFLTETLKALKRDGVQVDRISENHIREIFKHVGSRSLMKESISGVAIWLSKNDNKAVQDALAALSLQSVSGDELEELVDRVLSENRNLVKERGEAASGVIMGILMKDLRGKVDAALLSKILKEKLRDA